MNGNFFFGVIKRAKNDRFLRHSFVFFLGSFLISAGNYFFHFLMVRMLSVEHYGEVQSLLAISVIFGIPISGLSTVLIKYTAHFKALGQQKKIRSLFSFFTNRVLLAIFIFSVFFFALSGFIADFLNLNSVWPVIILGLTFIPTFLSSINRGIIQGLERFTSISVIGLAEVAAKIFLAFILVKIGFEVNGSIGAIVLAGLVGYFFTFLPLKFFLQQKGDRELSEIKEIFQYFLPTFLILLFLTLFYNIDVVLVKHFLSSRSAGEYGALALIGHIIFFISGPIVSVMFPMTSAAYANNTNPSKILKKTIILVSLVGSIVLLVYFLLPELVIKTLVDEKFLPLACLLGWFGLAMFLYSLIVIFVQYFLSVHKTKCFYLVAGGVGLQILLISVWHRDLWQIVGAMNGVMIATLLSLIFYYFKITKLCSIN